LWPSGTEPKGTSALETPFTGQNGHADVEIRLQPASSYAFLDFVLFFPDENRWDNNGGKNYHVPLGAPAASGTELLEMLKTQAGEQERSFERVFEVDSQRQLAVLVTKAEGNFKVACVTNIPGNLLLHWGIARRSPNEWLAPPASALGQGDAVLEAQSSAQTPFSLRDGLNWLQLNFSETDSPLGLQFVLKRGTDGGAWLKYRNGNFYVPVRGAVMASGDAVRLGSLSTLADEIIRTESHNSWTLMHRFNLCWDLLDRVQNEPEGLALLYVWLRFSAIRQLTWQRNYNTKPRELAHSQDRLTLKLADLFRSQPVARPFIRLILTTVGRGGEGQRIRDEILNIMHRHHIKEVSGHFLEEWHQKLHNNTTPDDVVICEAYLEFLRSGGNLDRFYEVLKAGGVTRERLESFERPIRSHPDFVPHLRDALLHDFGNFLVVLKAAHSGTDFDTALNASLGGVDGELHGLLNSIAGHRNDGGEGLVPLASKITEARRRLARSWDSGNGLRELLYLDLALEQLLRGAIERNVHLRPSGEALAELITRLLENLSFTGAEPELTACWRHWDRLQTVSQKFGEEWALHAKAVTDRMARALAAWIDRLYQMLQPKAEYLGQGFQAEAWAITLFSEEVVRGSSLGFALSMLLHQIEPLLRKAAHVSPWQLISRGHGFGKVEMVQSLHAIQQTTFKFPVVVIVDEVSGDEELPEGVTAVIAPDVTDIVSHVAVRARNSNVLFAACLDPEQFHQLKGFRGREVEVEVEPSGDVRLRESAAQVLTVSSPSRPPKLSLAPRKFSTYAVPLNEFNPKILGGKSCHLAELRGKLPDPIKLPASAAVPFGVFEKLLGLPSNKELASKYTQLAARADDGVPEALEQLRQLILLLNAPDEFRAALQRAFKASGLAWPQDWNRTWDRVKRVWASKWNERAHLSRKKMGLRHQDIFMAVLIQQVVPADYAFVLHTVNPSTGNSAELFGEIVLGLGETLVGNYPGRAFSFAFEKSSGHQKVLGFPAKSTALYGGGLIFRSDSNAEDLEGYAGAGLYDSVLFEEPRHQLVDYTNEPLVWDETFRRNLDEAIGKVGLEVERACGSPQDVEGAVAGGQCYVVQTRPQVGLEPGTR
jgi:alpha-glucan,water dikinase